MSIYLSQQVQDFIEAPTGNAYDILVIATPPQHGKSMTISESLPAWYMGKYPRKRVLISCYNEETAQKFARRNAEKVRLYGKTLFGFGMGQIDRATEFELDNNIGRLISRGIMSGITGNPADFVIIDDPIKNREEADSRTIRDKLWTEWLNSVKSRLSAGAKVILIMTPWHEDDLRARLLNSERNIRYIRLPVEAEPDDPLGRRVGEALCPELGKDNAWLAQYKQSYITDSQGGSRAWQALYQCSPRVEGGNLVERDWWRFYKPSDVTRFGSQFISVDATFKGTDTSDFVAIEVWGKLHDNFYCRYCLNRHLTFSQTLDSIRMVRQLFPEVNVLLIEDKANGSAIIDVLQREMFCIPVTPKGGKESRLNAVSPAIESGHVFLPEDAPWTEEFIEQFSAFPAGAHDDMVDSATQALARLIYANGVPTGEPSKENAVTTRAQQTFLDDDLAYDIYNSRAQADEGLNLG